MSPGGGGGRAEYAAKPGPPRERPQVLKVATGLLGKFIGMREPNIKYLGLESLMRLAEVPAVAETIDK